MISPLAAAFGLALIACAAHCLGAMRQVLSTSPKKLIDSSAKNFEVVDRNWVMAMCAFQLVTVDLLLLCGVLYLLAFTQVIGPARQVAMFLSGLYGLWGVAWLVQLLLFKRRMKDFFILSQWLYWFFMAALIYWGAQSL